MTDVPASIEVLASTPLVTVQDLGRPGRRALGVASAGAMDALALRVGNAMLGNAPQAAALEATLSPLRLRFRAATSFALTGADGEARLDGRAVPPWWTMRAEAGSELVLRAPRGCLRAYVALAGGIASEPVLGARSTDVKSSFGGIEGRAVAAGDVLPLGPGGSLEGLEGGFGVLPPQRVLADPAAPDCESDVTVRVLPAAEYRFFTEASREALWSTP
jgi:biotin-dependent carboxylase-like uncharacterized protein